MDYTPLNNITLYTPVQCLVPTGYQMVYTFVPVPPVLQMPLMLPFPSPVNYSFNPPPVNFCGPSMSMELSPSGSSDSGECISESSTSDLSGSFSASVDRKFCQSRSTSVDRPLEATTEMIPSSVHKIAVENVHNIVLPALKEEMTKREIVNATLTWLSQVFEEKFDTIGNRGEFVLRVKIKTREALNHFCPFVEQCISEKLLCRISCPISTKNGRKHIRGYLAYMEATDGRTANRILELFDLYNQHHGGVFAGEMVLNPKSTRPKQH